MCLIVRKFCVIIPMVTTVGVLLSPWDQTSTSHTHNLLLSPHLGPLHPPLPHVPRFLLTLLHPHLSESSLYCTFKSLSELCHPWPFNTFCFSICSAPQVRGDSQTLLQVLQSGSHTGSIFADPSNRKMQSGKVIKIIIV